MRKPTPSDTFVFVRLKIESFMFGSSNRNTFTDVLGDKVSTMTPVNVSQFVQAVLIEPVNTGVFGTRGVGKTTVLHHIEAALHAANFPGDSLWAYSDTDIRRVLEADPSHPKAIFIDDYVLSREEPQVMQAFHDLLTRGKDRNVWTFVAAQYGFRQKTRDMLDYVIWKASPVAEKNCINRMWMMHFRAFTLEQLTALLVETGLDWLLLDRGAEKRGATFAAVRILHLR